MSSIHASSNQLNYYHMYDVPDLQEVKRDIVVPLKDTLLYAIANNSKFSIFYRLIRQANMEKFFNDPDQTATVFLPPDKSFSIIPNHVINQIESKSPLAIVSFHTLKAPFSIADMKYSRRYAKTLYPRENLLIEGRGISSIIIGHRYTSNSVTPSINYNATIIEGDILCSNGIIHIISVPLSPGV
jgi:uncharacterized surface protein with fasciclin (FAS1) repeats